mgnify:CR=1 FL=1
MRTLTVALGARSYPIHIGRDLLGEAALLLPHLKTPRVAIVTNEVVAPRYLDDELARLDEALAEAKFKAVPGGPSRAVFRLSADH